MRGSCSRQPCGEDERQAVQQQIARKRGARPWRRTGDSAGNIEQAAGACHPTRKKSCAPSLEIGITGEARVERLEPAGRLQQQLRSVTTAVLSEGDLSPQQISAGAPELVERFTIRSGQETASHTERPGP